MFIKHQLLLKLCLSLWEASSSHPNITAFAIACTRKPPSLPCLTISTWYPMMRFDVLVSKDIKGIKAGFDATKLLPKARPVYCYCFNDGTGTVQICEVNQCWILGRGSCLRHQPKDTSTRQSIWTHLTQETRSPAEKCGHLMPPVYIIFLWDNPVILAMRG